MGWARFDDNYTTSSKILEAGYLAELLDMRAIIYCARNTTDGLITPSALKLLLRGLPPKAKREVDTLIAVGRWQTEPGGGWWVHDFLAYNPSKAEQDAKREAGKERVRKHRGNALQARNSLGDGTGIIRGNEKDEQPAEKTKAPWVEADQSWAEWNRKQLQAKEGA